MTELSTPSPAPLPLEEMEAHDAIARVLRRAARRKASDLFILTERNSVKVSIRSLGKIEHLTSVSPEQGRHLISHVKTMSNMDISEHRRPADGRWLFQGSDLNLDMRVNSIATMYGEDISIRLWNRDEELLTLDELGMTNQEVATLKMLLDQPAGLLLVTGPTGTGKTTTCYACIAHLNDGTRKINTLEDPVEHAMDGVRQSQVAPKIGIDFPDLLRGILRQAPDVIMIGEIRDEHTATTAVRAANSGHLVVATLHAPIAAGAVQSMLALGAHPYFLSSCLLGVIAQRLLRTLCQCKVRYDIGDADTFAEVADSLSDGEGTHLHGPGGCETCYFTGYIRRTGLFEIMTMSQELRRLVAASVPSDVLHRAATGSGMTEFRRGALLRVARGETSIEEVMQSVPAEYLGVED